MAIALLCLMIVVGSWLFQSEPDAPSESPPTSVATDRTRVEADAGARAGSDAASPGFLLGLAVAAALAVVAMARARQVLGLGRDDEEVDEDTDIDLLDRGPVAAALAASLDDLANERDPRRAVVAAYARMQTVLSAAGLPRRPSESEAELLRRLLGHLGAGGDAAARLTDLFEQARYSEHVVDEDMRAAAIDAVRQLRDQLLVGA